MAEGGGGGIGTGAERDGAAALRGALTGALVPVRRRRPALEAGLLMLVGGLQLAAIAYLSSKGQPGEGRGVVDLTDPAILTKLGLFAAAAVGLSVSAVLSFDPASRWQGRVGAGVAFALPLAATMLLDRDRPAPGLIDSLQPNIGIGAILVASALSVPVLLATVMLARASALTRPRRSGLLAGAAAGSWGILAYAIQCPMVSVWYVLPWYGGTVVLMALVARALVERLARW